MKKKHTGKTGGAGKSAGHTGKIVHGDMGSYLDGKGGKDSHMDPAHHEANCDAGMEDGMSPQGGYSHGGEEHGGEAMGDNAAYE